MQRTGYAIALLVLLQIDPTTPLEYLECGTHAKRPLSMAMIAGFLGSRAIAAQL
jgi:hypothetical protein